MEKSRSGFFAGSRFKIFATEDHSNFNISDWDGTACIKYIFLVFSNSCPGHSFCSSREQKESRAKFSFRKNRLCWI